MANMDPKIIANRKFSPSAARNRDAIFDALNSLIPKGAHILEIASGSGEHGLHICNQRRDITWQPTDIDPTARASQAACQAICDGELLYPVEVDVMKAGWQDKFEGISGIFCANMIHIAPWEAAMGLAHGAFKLLNENELLVLYGPFLTGDDTANSNLAFDRSLKSRNPAWGVRDLASVKHIFAMAGFNTVQTIAMPSNNLILVFQRS